MPGRRMPERPAGIARAEHLKSAFLGGLSGNTSIPAPVDRFETIVRQDQERVVKFARDEFIISEYVPEQSGVGNTYAAFYPFGETGFKQTHRSIFGSELLHYYHKNTGLVQQISYHQWNWFADSEWDEIGRASCRERV